MEQPNYVLKFNDEVMIPRNESRVKTAVKVLLLCFGVLFLIGLFLSGMELFREIRFETWACVIFALGFLKKQGGHVKEPSPCELWFYDDYLVQYCERRYYSRNNIRKEYTKFYYKDIKRCLYRTVVKKVVIYGVGEFTYYKYDKNGNVNSKPSVHKTVDSVSAFYTVLEPDIDFVKEIEEHSPIHVELEEC